MQKVTLTRAAPIGEMGSKGSAKRSLISDVCVDFKWKWAWVEGRLGAKWRGDGRLPGRKGALPLGLGLRV